MRAAHIGPEQLTTPTAIFVTESDVAGDAPISVGEQSAPPTVSGGGGGGALGWGAISILSFAVAMRCRQRRDRLSGAPPIQLPRPRETACFFEKIT